MARRRRAAAITTIAICTVGLIVPLAASAAPASGSGRLAQSTLSVSGPSQVRHLGAAVAVSANTVVVGAPYRQIGSNEDQGAVYVYTRPASGWRNLTQTAVLTDAAGAAFDQFGESVAISHDTIVVGSFNGTHALVFVKPAKGWRSTSHATAKLSSSPAQPDEDVGDAVAISGNTIVAGDSGRTVASNADQGAVLVYRKPASGWHDTTQDAVLTATSGVADDFLGLSVAVNGDTIVAGASSHNASTGLAYIYTKPAGGWADATETTTLEASDPSPGDDFGYGVAVSGTTVAIGANSHSTAGTNHAGTEYVFVRPASGWSAGTLTETAQLHPSSSVQSGFGTTVAMAGPAILVGAPQQTVGSTTFAGAIYLFVKPAAGWTTTSETSRIVARGAQQGDELSQGLGYDGRTIVGGSPFRRSEAGAAYVFAPPRPKLSKVKQSHRSWLLGPAKPATNPKHISHKFGTVFSFALNQAAKVTMSFSERRHGHYRHVGSLAFHAAAGHTREYVASKLRHHKRLKPGHCKMTITAKNSNGASGRALHFTIRRPKHPKHRHRRG